MSNCTGIKCGGLGPREVEDLEKAFAEEVSEKTG